MKSNKFAIMVVLALLAQARAAGAEYHVAANGGDDRNPGTVVLPWRTLEMANRAVQPGDVVTIHGGTYTDGIEPLRSGRDDQPIVFRPFEGERVIVRANRGAYLRPTIAHVRIEGLQLEGAFRSLDIEGATGITVRNCRLLGGRGSYEAVSLLNASYCRIEGCFLDRGDPVGMGAGGDGLKVLGKSHHNVIEGNVVTGCAHQGLGSSYGDGPKNYNVFRNNVVYGCHTNLGFEENVDRYLIEGNVSYYPGLVYTPDGGHSLQVSGTRNSIYRYNVLYDDTASIAPTDIVQQVVGTSAFPYHDMTGNKFYNNTMYGESDESYGRYVFRIDENFDGRIIDDNVLKNNILARPTRDFPVVNEESNHRPTMALNTVYDGNLLWRARAGDPVVRLQGTDGNFIWTLEEVKRTRPSFWGPLNIEGDPLFVNAVGQGAAKDFHLRHGSPAVDAGTHLTVAAAGGSWTTDLQVQDAGYFTDGWGIIEADSLKIEGAIPSEAVGIVSVDYTSNRIGMTSPRTWRPGARVWYYRSDRFRGSAPDIGALEYGTGGTSPPSPPPPPAWLLVSLPRVPPSTNADSLFPGRDGSIFTFQNVAQNYDPVASLSVGTGYWVKYTTPPDTLIAVGRDVDSIAVEATRIGWVLFGSISWEVPISRLSTVPAGAIISPVFRYNTVSQLYEPVGEIRPGDGHWVKVDRVCRLIVR